VTITLRKGETAPPRGHRDSDATDLGRFGVNAFREADSGPRWYGPPRNSPATRELRLKAGQPAQSTGERSPQRWKNAHVQEPPELQRDARWRMAVWALRVGYLGLATAIAGVIVLSLGSTPWILAVGVVVWLAAAAVTLTGFLLSRSALPDPRPGYWPMRFMLVHDTVHARDPGQLP
jgi:hypothetical protein